METHSGHTPPPPDPAPTGRVPPIPRLGAVFITGADRPAPSGSHLSPAYSGYNPGTPPDILPAPHCLVGRPGAHRRSPSRPSGPPRCPRAPSHRAATRSGIRQAMANAPHSSHHVRSPHFKRGGAHGPAPFLFHCKRMIPFERAAQITQFSGLCPSGFPLIPPQVRPPFCGPGKPGNLRSPFISEAKCPQVQSARDAVHALIHSLAGLPQRLVNSGHHQIPQHLHVLRVHGLRLNRHSQNFLLAVYRASTTPPPTLAVNSVASTASWAAFICS